MDCNSSVEGTTDDPMIKKFPKILSNNIAVRELDPTPSVHKSSKNSEKIGTKTN